MKLQVIIITSVAINMSCYLASIIAVFRLIGFIFKEISEIYFSVILGINRKVVLPRDSI